MYFEKRIPIFLQLGFQQKSIPRLKAYIDFLWSSNQELNLISRQMTFEELIDNHLIDCLLPLNKFPKNIQKAADFGSGGGLPAIVYAIHFENIEFSLFEKSNKKQIFLNQCKNFSPNIKVYGEIRDHLNEIDIVTARAFKPIDVILQMSRSSCENAGKYFLLKGRLEKIQEELTIAKKSFKRIECKIEKLNSPVLDVERHLVII